MIHLRNGKGQRDGFLDEACGAHGVRECGGTAEQRPP